MSHNKSEAVFVIAGLGIAAAVCASMFVGWEVRREVYTVPEDQQLVAVDNSAAGKPLRSYPPGTEIDVRVWWNLWTGERMYGYGVAKK